MATIKMDSLEGTGEPIIIVDEDGHEYELNVLCEIDYEEESYLLATAYDDFSSDDDEKDCIVLKCIEGEYTDVVEDVDLRANLIAVYNEHVTKNNSEE